MQHVHAPLYEMLLKHADSKPVSFHVPGHRYGQAFGVDKAEREGEGLESDFIKEMKEAFAAIMKLDVTELSATDDLHHPEGAIAEAQGLAARCFGAEESFFLVGGSTSGNLAMLLAVCEPGDYILVQRNVHKSVINGLKLAGARAVFIMPQIDEHTGIATQPSLAQVQMTMYLYPQAKAVFLNNPNYYGMSVNLRQYAEAIHQSGMLLLVDEAHGAHYGLHPELPGSAIAAGADAVVQSTHKTLTALTMGAMLHVQGELLNRSALREALATIQSSSPSFPIMASLDISRAMIEAAGVEWFEDALAATAYLRKEIEECCSAIEILKPNDDRLPVLPAYNQLDPLRIVLWDRTGALSGFEILKLLEQQGCWAEMADMRHVVLLFGIGIQLVDVDRLIQACQAVEVIIASMGRVIAEQPLASAGYSMFLPESVEPITFSRVSKGTVIRVNLADAVNRKAGEMVVPYPPGIPIVYPGELLTMEMLDYIKELASSGAKFQGAEDPAMQSIAIVE
ncbi:Arginine/lysine/ornithine decarboxylase [Paenibacillus algorifonticola]|uniref:Arginine/lysine/ornithine decarboxylase n=1 Tax=Paenibacillus algorifonticola TaxID=684063 RepID=A0A1I2IN70_9BACL|nr:aminotransferase class I/II-fold pyridoxal phosphate-dependent enzyme [Paenibacillus algorifonticola]SFF43755.1 Arginine/lysine/ornithine decarboxylase [Paenibacillus algorifonticola]